MVFHATGDEGKFYRSLRFGLTEDPWCAVSHDRLSAIIIIPTPSCYVFDDSIVYPFSFRYVCSRHLRTVPCKSRILGGLMCF